MKAKPFKFDGKSIYAPCEPKEATHVSLRLPCGCYALMLPVLVGNQTRFGTPNWNWNGDVDKPTIRPSVLSRGHNFTCHSWINNGEMQFLSDTTGEGHAEFANKTIPLKEHE
jgi:hypothetical protein